MAGPQLSRLVCLAAALCALATLGDSKTAARRLARDQRDQRELETLHRLLNGGQPAPHPNDYRLRLNSNNQCYEPQLSLRRQSGLNGTQRIAGGFLALPSELPSFVGILVRGKDGVDYICGGVLLTSNLVLTANHCAKDRVSFKVAPSIWHPLAWAEKNVDTYKGALACLSPDYGDGLHMVWDYAVIVLDRPVRTGGDVQTACMGLKPMPPDSLVLVAGVGQEGSHFNPEGQLLPLFPPKLKVAHQKVIPCLAKDLHPSHLCTSSVSPDKAVSSCRGDSGGGVYSWIDGTLVLVGLMSFGRGNTVCNPQVESYNVHMAVHNWAYNLKDFATNCLKRAAAIHQRDKHARASSTRARVITLNFRPNRALEMQS